jgi:hypothetical protein
VNGDAEIGKPLAACHDIRAGGFTSNAESDDGWMLEKEEQVWHPVSAPFLDQFALKHQRLVVANQAQSPDFHRARA